MNLPSPPESNTTRRAFLAAGAALGLAGCGGGGGTPAPAPVPAIDSLSAEPVAVGDAARITAVFSGGAGRIEPDVGAVTSGVPAVTPRLAGPRAFTLVVQAPGQPALRRELWVRPSYRDRYVALPESPWLQYHAAVAAPDGAVIVIGGSRGLGVLSDAIDRFDPTTRRFTRIGTMYTGRSLHSATPLPGGKALVAGGQVGLTNGGFAELVDLGTGAVEAAGWPVRPRSFHAACALDDGRVVLVGGFDDDTVELWDPATRRFRLVAARMHNRREWPTATRLADGRVLIVGGSHTAEAQRLAEVFDPRTETFEPVASPLDGERRSLHAAHLMPDGRVLVLGGEVHTAAGLMPLDTALRFDPATQSLAVDGRLGTARTVVRSVLLPDGIVRLFGGQAPDEPALRTAEAYPPGLAQPRLLAPMPAARGWHTLTPLPDGRVLILGGDDAGGQPVMTALLYE